MDNLKVALFVFGIPWAVFFGLKVCAWLKARTANHLEAAEHQGWKKGYAQAEADRVTPIRFYNQRWITFDRPEPWMKSIRDQIDEMTEE